MKKLLACSLIPVVTFLIGFSLYSIHPDTIEKNKVLQLMLELHEAEKNKDEDKLKQIFADEVLYSRYKDERIFAKNDLIETIKNVEFEIKAINADFVSTAFENNRIKIYFWMTINFINEDNEPFDHVGNYTYTFEKQSEEWKLISIHMEN